MVPNAPPESPVSAYVVNAGEGCVLQFQSPLLSAAIRGTGGRA